MTSVVLDRSVQALGRAIETIETNASWSLGPRRPMLPSALRSVPVYDVDDSEIPGLLCLRWQAACLDSGFSPSAPCKSGLVPTNGQIDRVREAPWQKQTAPV